jgi:hypothetical protein
VQSFFTKAHATVSFSSYNSAGERYQTSSAFWVLVKKDSRWVIKMRSWLGADA